VRQCVWAVLLLFISLTLEAAEPFYQVSTPVASQAPEARAQAASKALKDMLWRLTGSKQAEQNAAMARVFSQAETYADSFTYTGAGEVTFAFSPQALNQLIKDYALPYWPANRPKVLVWASINGQWPAAGDANSDAMAQLKAQAVLRGINLVFPKYDSEDRTALSLEQFKALDNEALLNASFRYSLDTIMAVQWSDDGGRWQFDHRGEKRTGDNAVQGINALADFLAARYAVGGSGSAASGATAFINISAANFAQFKQINDYLKKHSLITASRLLQSNGHELVFEISLRASLSQFNGSLALDQRLEPSANSDGMGTLNAPLNYRWIAN
jgi:uncharacterized protein